LRRDDRRTEDSERRKLWREDRGKTLWKEDRGQGDGETKTWRREDKWREDRGRTDRKEREQEERTVSRGQGRRQGGVRTGMGDYRKDREERG